VGQKIRESKCGVYGVVGAGGRSHERPCCRISAVVGQNRALWSLWERSFLNFQTGGCVGAECAAVFVVAFVPETSARGGWGRRPPPPPALLLRLPPTRRWPVDDRARDARLHAATGGGH